MCLRARRRTVEKRKKGRTKGGALSTLASFRWRLNCAQVLPPLSLPPITLHDLLSSLTERVTKRACTSVIVFDASRLGSWERQHGSRAFEAILDRFYDEVNRLSLEIFGESTQVCFDAQGGDMVLVFPVRNSSNETTRFVDMEEQLHTLNAALLERLAPLQIWFHEALEMIASGSSVILHSGAVDPRRAIYRATHKAMRDAQISHGEVQRRRNRVVGHVIAHRKLDTLYQPIFQLDPQSSGEPLGYEALSRPLAREARKLGVHLFVAAARADLDGELDATCRALSITRRPSLSRDEKLFINCLPPTFYDDMRDLEGILEKWEESGMQPDQLVFELTESITKNQVARILKNVEKLRTRGYMFALDDVGTGTSNLELLAEVEPDFIKMDMSLTIGISESTTRQNLAQYLLDLAQRGGAHLIAEGIENESDLHTLREIGVPFGQGFLLGRPSVVPPLHACS